MIARLALLIVVVVLAGCQTTTRQSTPKTSSDVPQAPISNTDPCATRLHDISGTFLLYLLDHNDLPQTLHALTPYAQRLGVTDLTCPVSGKPYIYSPDGILLPEQNSRIILYDAEPSHSGYRWVIAIGAPTPEQPPRTKVIALPESFFLLRPPTR